MHVRAAVLMVLLAACSRSDAASGSPAPTPSASSASGSPAPTPSASSSTSATPPAPTAAPSVVAADAPADTFVEAALRATDNPDVDDWLARAKELRLQVLVTVVPPGAKGPDDLEEHGFRVDAEYFYPASAIKTLLAIATLRFLDELSEKRDVPLPPNVRIMRCDAPAGRCEVPKADEDDDPDDDVDEEKPTVSREIRKMLAWSDNDSYDRLYDLVGHERLNELMAELGFSSVRFHHRMSSKWQPKKTRRLRVYPYKGAIFTLPSRTSTLTVAPTPASDLEFGRAHKTAKGLVEEPMSFAKKNYVSLRDLHRSHIAVVRPDLSPLSLGLDEAEHKVIVAPMTGRVVGGKHGAVHKPMVNGLLEASDSDGLVYINKSGRAYGFHLDNAYIEDTETGRAFFVTAVIYANPDGVLNDDDYAYEELSDPFFEALGEGLARKLLKSTKAGAPAETTPAKDR